jgi:hypothetical protein
MLKLRIASILLLSATNSAFAQTRIIPSDTGFAISINWFDGSACSVKERNSFHFRIGSHAFVVEPKSLTRARLSKIKSASQSNGAMTVEISKTAGCKSDPLALIEAEIQPGRADFPKAVVLVETTVDSASGVTKFVQHLQSTDACRTTTQPNLMMCAGTRDAGKIKVFFMLPTNNGKFVMQKYGLPVHARCEDPAGTIYCFVSATIGSDVTAKIGVDPKSLSAESITQLYGRTITFAEGIQLRGN